MALAIDRALRYQIVPPAWAEDSELDDARGYAAHYEVVVCEDWRLRPATARNFIGSSFPSVQFIGMVRLCCWLSNTKLVMQGADTKSTADKTMAQLWPAMYEKVSASRAHDDAHDMDAIRHLWFYTYRNTDGIPQPQEAA
jgi:hypothetical protein